MSLTPASHDLTRRQMLGRSAALLAGLTAGGGVVSVASGAHGAPSEVTFQLGWIMSNGQIGEVAAKSLGCIPGVSAAALRASTKLTPSTIGPM